MFQSAQPRTEVVSALSAVHVAADLAAWRDYFTRKEVCVVTSTITEAGYLCDANGEVDLGLDAVRADVAALRQAPLSAPVTTAPGRFVAGLLARRQVGDDPITFVPCDNVVGSGRMVSDVVHQVAQAVDPTLVGWIEERVGFVSTMVDRITPTPTSSDLEALAALTGYDDPAGVVAEPFAQWVLAGEFRTDHPDWASAGAQFVADVVPFEHCKLWLLNGAHSLMAYAGPLRGHVTVQEAIADPVVAAWVQQWWAEASSYVPLPTAEIVAYERALVERFENPAMRDVLSRIAADGSQKLPIRLVPTIRAELAAGRSALGGLRAVAAWVWHLRGRSTPVNDARLDEGNRLGGGTLDESVTSVVDFLGLPAAVGGTVRRLADELQP
jgi:fructuronate reductase